MSNEIKEILDYISDRVIEKEKWDAVRNYITNLQEENERLKGISYDPEETNNKWVEEESELKKVYRERKDYKSRVEKALDKIQYIIDYGFDYDGFNNVEDLKGLIDMLVNYARESKDILRGKEND